MRKEVSGFDWLSKPQQHHRKGNFCLGGVDLIPRSKAFFPEREHTTKLCAGLLQAFLPHKKGCESVQRSRHIRMLLSAQHPGQDGQ